MIRCGEHQNDENINHLATQGCASMNFIATRMKFLNEDESHIR